MRRSPALTPIVTAGACAAIVVALAICVQVSPSVPAIDVWWNDVVDERPNGVLFWIATILNVAGAGILGAIVVPLALAIVLLVAKRPDAAACLIIATALTGGIVQLIKKSIARERPADQLVASDFGSFPSGHAAHAAVMTVVLALVVWRVWMWALAALWTIAMLWSRTYLHAHWLTDVVAGALLGAAIAVVCWWATQRAWQRIQARQRQRDRDRDREHHRPEAPAAA